MTTQIFRVLSSATIDKREIGDAAILGEFPLNPSATRAISQWASILEWRHAVTLHILVGKICISFFLFYCEGMLFLVVLWLCADCTLRNIFGRTRLRCLPNCLSFWGANGLPPPRQWVTQLGISRLVVIWQQYRRLIRCVVSCCNDKCCGEYNEQLVIVLVNQCTNDDWLEWGENFGEFNSQIRIGETYEMYGQERISEE